MQLTIWRSFCVNITDYCLFGPSQMRQGYRSVANTVSTNEYCVWRWLCNKVKIYAYISFLFYSYLEIQLYCSESVSFTGCLFWRYHPIAMSQKSLGWKWSQSPKSNKHFKVPTCELDVSKCYVCSLPKSIDSSIVRKHKALSSSSIAWVDKKTDFF